MDPLMAAWLAGLYEGEGYLHRLKSGNGYQLGINMTDRDIVARLPVITGYGKIRRWSDGGSRPATWKPLWGWRVGNRDSIAILLDAMLPYLGTRRGAAADEFLTWYDEGCPSLRTDAQRAREAAERRTHRANQRLKGNS